MSDRTLEKAVATLRRWMDTPPDPRSIDPEMEIVLVALSAEKAAREAAEKKLAIAKRWLDEQDAECAILKDRLGMAEAALAAAEKRVGELEALVDEARKVIKPFAAYGLRIHPAATDDILLLGYEGAPVAIGGMRAATSWLAATPTDLLNKRLVEVWDQAIGETDSLVEELLRPGQLALKIGELTASEGRVGYAILKLLQHRIRTIPNLYRQPATQPKNGETKMNEDMELDGMAKHASVMAEVVTLSRDEIRAKYSTDPNWPIQSFDATDWAAAFRRNNPSMDEGLMISWFANALMRGFDEANARNATQPQNVTEPD